MTDKWILLEIWQSSLKKYHQIGDKRFIYVTERNFHCALVHVFKIIVQVDKCVFL